MAFNFFQLGWAAKHYLLVCSLKWFDVVVPTLGKCDGIFVMVFFSPDKLRLSLFEFDVYFLKLLKVFIGAWSQI